LRIEKWHQVWAELGLATGSLSKNDQASRYIQGDVLPMIYEQAGFDRHGKQAFVAKPPQ